MAVRIRMKRLGRRHRPFYRICAMDSRSPRDGRAIEELGHYDPMVRETDARAVLNNERIDYWLGVGALPSENVKVLIKKYGTSGTHLDQQKTALERIAAQKPITPPQPVVADKQPAEEAVVAEQQEQEAQPEPEQQENAPEESSE